MLMIVLPASVGHAWACPPGSRDLRASIGRAQVIVVGTALEATRTRGRDLRTTRFRLERVYKGPVPPGPEVTVRSCVGSKCGPSFAKGQRYVVFAFSDAEGRLSEQGACGWTRRLDKEDAAVQELMTELEKLGGEAR